MVYNLIETGLGLNYIAMFFSKNLQKEDLQKVYDSCVRNNYPQLKQEVIIVKNIDIVTNNTHLSWAKASLNIFK